MLSSDRYKAMQSPPKEPSNPEYDYLQAKSTGYGGGTLFGNVGASLHNQTRLGSRPGRRKSLGDVLAFFVVMAAAVWTFVEIAERTDQVFYAILGAFVAMFICGKVCEMPGMRRTFNILAWIGGLGGVVYFIASASGG